MNPAPMTGGFVGFGSAQAAPTPSFGFGGAPAPAAAQAPPSSAPFSSARPPSAPFGNAAGGGGGSGGSAFGGIGTMKKTTAMTFGGAGAGTSAFGAFGSGSGGGGNPPPSSSANDADEAAAKARALAQMPTFLGSGGGGGGKSGAINADDAEERAARARRNARFGDGPPPSSTFAAATATPLPFATNDEDDFGALQRDQLARGAPIVGTCEAMCPDSEIERRHRIEDVAVFERIDPSVARTNRELAVKKFARNIEQRADNFRTRSALDKAQAHLRGIMDSGTVNSSSTASSLSRSASPPLSLVHRFLWDRYRGIRQDLFVQGIEDAWAASLYEEHVRFMILAEHELCELQPQAGEAETFDSHLNLEQINKSLISLGTMYDQLASTSASAAAANGGGGGEGGDFGLASEAEFRGYHLLTLAGTHGRYRFSASTLRDALASLRRPVLSSEPVRRALRFARALSSGDWASFFDELEKAPYLDSCLAQMFTRGMRAKALTMLAAAEGGQAFPVSDLARSLRLQPGEGGAATAVEACVELLRAAGLEVDGGPTSASFSSPEGPTVTLPRGATFEADDIPKWRSPAVTAKGNPRRSVDATGGGASSSTAAAPFLFPPPASTAAAAAASFGAFGGGGAAAAAPAATPPPSYPPASFAFGAPQQQPQAQAQAPDASASAAAAAVAEAERARQEHATNAAAAASAAAAAEKEAAERRAAEEAAAAAAAAAAAEAERACQEQAARSAAEAAAAAAAAAAAEAERRRALEEQEQQRRRLEEEARARAAAEAAAAAKAAAEEEARRRQREEEERRRREEQEAARQREIARVAAEAAARAAAAAAVAEAAAQAAHDAAVRNLTERATLRRARHAALRWRAFARAARERRAAAERREAALKGTRVGPRLAVAAAAAAAVAAAAALTPPPPPPRQQHVSRRSRPLSASVSLPRHARAAGFARLVAPGLLKAERQRLRALAHSSSSLEIAAEQATAGDDLWFKLCVSSPSSSSPSSLSSAPSPAAAAAASWLRRALPSAGRRSGGVLFSFAVEVENRFLRACAREVNSAAANEAGKGASASSALVLLIAADETPSAVAPRLRALVAAAAAASSANSNRQLLLPLLIVVASSPPGEVTGEGAKPLPPPPPAADIAAWASAELRAAAFPGGGGGGGGAGGGISSNGAALAVSSTATSSSPVSSLRVITVDASASPSTPCDALARGIEWLAAETAAGCSPVFVAVPLAALARRAARTALSSAAASSASSFAAESSPSSPLALIGAFSSALDWVRGEAERAAAAATDAAGDDGEWGSSWPPADAGAVFVVSSPSPSSPSASASPPAIRGPYPGWASPRTLETISAALEAAAPPRGSFPLSGLASGEEGDVAEAVSGYCRRISCSLTPSSSFSYSSSSTFSEWRDELVEAMFSRLGGVLDASGICVVVGAETLVRAGGGGNGEEEEEESGGEGRGVARVAAEAAAKAPPLALALAPANGNAPVLHPSPKKQRWTLWRGAPRQSTAAPYCSAAVVAVAGLKRGRRVSSSDGGSGGDGNGIASVASLSPSARRQRTAAPPPAPAPAPPAPVAAAAMGALSRALSEARAAGGAFSAWLERAAGGGGGGGGRGRGRGGNEGGGGDDGDGDDPLGLSGNAVYSFANKASTNGGAAAAAASLGEFEAERDASAALTAALQRAAGGGL